MYKRQLQVPALKALKDYEKQKKAGKDPQFDPEALGIKNADFWVERKRARGEGSVLKDKDKDKDKDLEGAGA